MKQLPNKFLQTITVLNVIRDGKWRKSLIPNFIHVSQPDSMDTKIQSCS